MDLWLWLSVSLLLFRYGKVCEGALIRCSLQSCLALRYEALNLREIKSASYQWLEVSYSEWLNFAEQSLDYGFHSIARKVCLYMNSGYIVLASVCNCQSFC